MSCQPSASAREVIAGPVNATLVKVRDGDSIDVIAHVWPSHDIRVSVRIRGIDAAELRARCDMEKEKALMARDALSALLEGGGIKLSKVSGGKYFGRVLANVSSASGADVARHLLGQGLVRVYRGGKRQSWCPQPASLKR